MKQKHIVIVGGGVIGCSTAYRLLLKHKEQEDEVGDAGGTPQIERLSVTLLESSSHLASGASGKAGGFLAKTWCDGEPMETLARHSFDLHEEFAEQWQPRVDLGYRRLNAVSAAAAVTTNDDNSGSQPKPPRAVLPTSLDTRWMDGNTNEQEEGEKEHTKEKYLVEGNPSSPSTKLPPPSVGIDFESIGSTQDCAQVHGKKLCEVLRLAAEELCLTPDQEEPHHHSTSSASPSSSLDAPRRSITYLTSHHVDCIIPTSTPHSAMFTVESTVRGGGSGATIEHGEHKVFLEGVDEVVLCLGSWSARAMCEMLPKGGCYCCSSSTSTSSTLPVNCSSNRGKQQGDPNSHECAVQYQWSATPPGWKAKSWEETIRGEPTTTTTTIKVDASSVGQFKVQSAVLQPLIPGLHETVEQQAVPPPSQSGPPPPQLSSPPSPIYNEAIFTAMENYFGCDAELYPRPDGTVYVCGFSTTVSTRDLLPRNAEEVHGEVGVGAKLQEVAGKFCTSLKPRNSTVLVEQACFIPAPPDGRTPLVGAIPSCACWETNRKSCGRSRSGIWVASGHSCWGILTSHATGKVMAELILGPFTTLSSSSSSLCCDIIAMDPSQYFTKVGSEAHAHNGASLAAPRGKRGNENW